MADKDQQNDEYQFADLDTMTPDSGDQADFSEDGLNSAETEEKVPRAYVEENNIKRNALIVIALVIGIMVLYKLIGSFFSGTKLPEKSVPALITPTPAPVPTPAPAPKINPAPVMPTPQVNAPKSDGQMNEKLSALELGQQGMRSDIASVSSQMGGINTNLNTIVAKIAELNGIISNLNTKLDEQAREIQQLTVHRTAKKIHYNSRRAAAYPKYFIQAVIPGRAWLIATNGNTLTVREGTIIAGYGMVKLIDPNQGRVTTSSGQVIRFSQEDS